MWTFLSYVFVFIVAFFLGAAVDKYRERMRHANLIAKLENQANGITERFTNIEHQILNKARSLARKV